MRDVYITAFIITILFLASLTSASAADPANNVINVNLGQTFTISLPSNPSTGFQWHAIYDTTYLELVNQNFESDNPGVPGAGGNQTFTFKAIKSGQTNITFNYQRGNSAPENTTTFDIKIAANNAGNNTGNTTKTTTIPMLPTGAPLAGLTLGILTVLGGIIGSRRNNK